MSEWLKEHAWKAKRASGTKRCRSTLTHTRSATYLPRLIIRCASVNLSVDRGFRHHLSQSYHNHCFDLERVTQTARSLTAMERWRSRLRQQVMSTASYRADC